MENYKKIKSIMLQLQMLGDGKYGDEIARIQSRLPTEPYTVSPEDVIYANTVLNDAMRHEDKGAVKRLGKFIENFTVEMDAMDEADDFINDEKPSLHRSLSMIHRNQKRLDSVSDIFSNVVESILE